MRYDDSSGNRAAKQLRQYGEAVSEKQEPIYLTRNGEGEMVFLPIDLWEKRQAELELFAEMLRREQNKLAGAKTYSAAEMQAETEELLSES